MPKCSEPHLKQGYGPHLERVEVYIQAHLNEDLPLEKLAAVACFSKYHFHRIFKSLRGETIHDYIRRTRLEASVFKLKQNLDLSISEIAYACGFSSSQNFARAFKAHFGFTPVSVRNTIENGIPCGIDSGKSGTAQEVKLEPLPVEVRELPACRVAYIRYVGPYQTEPTVPIYYRLFRWALNKGILTSSSAITATRSDPRITPPEECVLDLCLPIAEDVQGDGEVCIQSLPGGAFAFFHGEINVTDIYATVQRIVEEWMPAHGYQNDLRPVLIIMYNNAYSNPRKLVIVDICVAIKPL